MNERLNVIFTHRALEYRSPTFAFADKETLLTSNHLLVLVGIATKKMVGYHFGEDYNGGPNGSESRLASLAIVASKERPTKKYIGMLNESLKYNHEERWKNTEAPDWKGHYVGRFTPQMAGAILDEDFVAEVSKLDPPIGIPNSLTIMHYSVSPDGEIDFDNRR